MAYTATSTSTGFNVIGAFQNLAHRIAAARHRRTVFNATRRELMALSNRSLDDLGVTRAEIDRVALEAAIGSAH